MQARSFSRAAAIVAVIVFLGVAARPALAGLEGSVSSERMKLELSSDPFRVTVTDSAGNELLETRGPITYWNVRAQKVWRFVLWWFWTPGIPANFNVVDEVLSASEDSGVLTAELGSSKGGPAKVRMKAWFIDGRSLKVELESLEDGDINRFKLGFKKTGSDSYWGMGERYNQVEHSGTRVRNWAEEGGLGLFTLGKYWHNNPINPFPKGPDLTYYPVPFFINAGKGYGFLLDDDRYSLFDFGVTTPGSLTVENYNDSLDFVVFHGPRALEVIEAQTEYTGRIEVPAPWVFAPMHAAVENEERVLEVASILREEGIPNTAIWTESWWWRVEWEVNRELFPTYEEMNAKLEEDGFRSLAYYQPYITKDTESYREADEKGYFIKDKKGETYDFVLGMWPKAQIDLTNPEAREWWAEKFFANSERMGVDGWMHDFAEHIPPDSVAHDGRDGWELHNDYVLLWHKLGHDFWKKTRPGGDYCIYVRAGYTGAQKYVPVMWTGDQNTNMDKADGMAANMPAIMSVGLSGHPIGTTDIAGFNCFVSRDTDRELFMRWTELGALLPVMRVHRGQDEFCDNWDFDQDRETLDHYKKYAVLHTSLFPYIYTLVHQAADRGWPVVRHLMLHYPEEAISKKRDFEYLLGDRVLVAPVIERNVTKWKVHLPEGEWAHWWTGETYSGPADVTVPADLGEVPMFVKAGSILPLFDTRIDTLAEEDRPDLNGWADANSSIKVVFYGSGKDAYQLWDGTVIDCESAGGQGSCQVSGAPAERTYTYDFR